MAVGTLSKLRYLRTIGRLPTSCSIMLSTGLGLGEGCGLGSGPASGLGSGPASGLGSTLDTGCVQPSV